MKKEKVETEALLKHLHKVYGIPISKLRKMKVLTGKEAYRAIYDKGNY